MVRVDVVIATHARNARLERTLRALAAQDYEDFRVIIADDASPVPVEPRTQAGADPVQVIRMNSNEGPARARNLAAARGTAELIAFVDDDVDPSRGWLAAHVAAHRRSQQLATIGPLLAPHDWRPTPWNWWEAATLAREYRRMAAGVYAPSCRQFFTGNAMVPRAEFEAVGGFDERLRRAEDIEFALRLAERGCTFAFLPEAAAWHYAHRTFASWLRMARQYAVADRQIDAAHPDAGWLSVMNEELAGRSWPLRLLRRAARAALVERAATAAGGAIARAAFAAGRRRESAMVLSALFDLAYWNAARQLERARMAAKGPATCGQPALNDR
jgi:GT2 family glycosyltransferase